MDSGSLSTAPLFVRLFHFEYAVQKNLLNIATVGISFCLSRDRSRVQHQERVLVAEETVFQINYAEYSGSLQSIKLIFDQW